MAEELSVCFLNARLNRYDHRLVILEKRAQEIDALVPGTQARAVAQQQANATGKPVTVRDPIADKVLATVRPAEMSVEQAQPSLAALCHRAGLEVDQ